MKALLLSLALVTGLIPALATEQTIAQAEADAANVGTLVLNGSPGEPARLVKLAPKLLALETVILEGITSDEAATELVSAVAACNKVRTINFRNCTLTTLPSNLRMLTQVTAFLSENTSVTDGDQFYNAIADMPNVKNVSVSGSDFRALPQSFSRLRVMDNINLVNTDLHLASGYDRNNKTADELRVTQSVQFGFGEDALNFSYTCYNGEAAKSHAQMFRDVLQGAGRASNEFYSPSAAAPFSKPHPLVKPPVAGVDIYPDVYTLNSLTGSVLEYGSGTRIIVPAMAFQDACGNPISGNVDITYREFRDAVDVVLSGIPMQYDSGGVVGDFESAGMFEMLASQNGEEVFLRDDKEISLKFAVTDTASDYNFYRLDEQNGWTYLENTGATEQDEPGGFNSSTTRAPEENAAADRDDRQTSIETYQASTTTSTAALYRNAIGQIFVRDWIRDTTDFDLRYSDTCYYGMNRAIDAASVLSPDEKCRRSSRLFLRKRAERNDSTVLSLRNVRGSYVWNTELNAYAGFHWMTDEKLSQKEVDERFGEESGINDCRVIQDGDEYYLDLKYYWGHTQIKVEPVRVNAEDQVVTVREKQKQSLFNSYTRRLNRRRTYLNNYNQEQVDRQKRGLERAHQDSVRAWTGLKKVMTAEEKAMDFTIWNRYVQNEEIYTYTRSFTQNLPGVFNKTRAMYQYIKIPTFGLYNCDRIVKVLNPVTFVTKAISVAGAVVIPAVIHVINKWGGRVMTYTGGAIGGVRATYEENTSNYLLITDAGGNLYKVSYEQFALGVNGGSKHVEFEADQLSMNGATAESVRNAVTIDRGITGLKGVNR